MNLDTVLTDWALLSHYTIKCSYFKYFICPKGRRQTFLKFIFILKCDSFRKPISFYMFGVISTESLVLQNSLHNFQIWLYFNLRDQ